MPELQDKVILVTGATAGIGRGCANVLAREGARVIVSSNQEKANHDVAAELPARAATPGSGGRGSAAAEVVWLMA